MLEKKRLFSVLVKSKYLSINMRFFFFKLEAVFILSSAIFLFKSNRRLNQYYCVVLGRVMGENYKKHLKKIEERRKLFLRIKTHNNF